MEQEKTSGMTYLEILKRRVDGSTSEEPLIITERQRESLLEKYPTLEQNRFLVVPTPSASVPEEDIVRSESEGSDFSGK